MICVPVRSMSWRTFVEHFVEPCVWCDARSALMATTSLAKVMLGESARFAKLPAIHASDQICAQSILAAQVILTPVLVVFRCRIFFPILLTGVETTRWQHTQNSKRMVRWCMTRTITVASAWHLNGVTTRFCVQRLSRCKQGMFLTPKGTCEMSCPDGYWASLGTNGIGGTCRDLGILVQWIFAKNRSRDMSFYDCCDSETKVQSVQKIVKSVGLKRCWA